MSRPQRLQPEPFDEVTRVPKLCPDCGAQYEGNTFGRWVETGQWREVDSIERLVSRCDTCVGHWEGRQVRQDLQLQIDRLMNEYGRVRLKGARLSIARALVHRFESLVHSSGNRQARDQAMESLEWWRGRIKELER